MVLPEIYAVTDVAKHLGTSAETIEREARRLGCIAVVGHRRFFSARMVEDLIEGLRSAPEQAPSRERRDGIDNSRPFTPLSLSREWGVSVTHVRNLIRRGQLAHFRLGKLVRISAAAVSEYEQRNGWSLK